jgi:xylulose-5-phosphate/fructose-6-phosphate phosphoketolase
LSDEELRKLHAFWRATNYLALGMIYLQDNPLLREKLKPEHVKSRMLGHWGTSPALSFIYTHLNRVIKLFDLDMVYMAGPGHGAPGVLGPVYIEGRYSEIYPEKGEDIDGLRRFFQEFSFPGGIGSHCTPETPGSTVGLVLPSTARDARRGLKTLSVFECLEREEADFFRKTTTSFQQLAQARISVFPLSY